MHGMTRPGKPRPFSQQTVLRDGTPILIRVLRPEDRAGVVAAFGKLEPDSIYTRFFSMKKELSEAELDHLGSSDFEHYLALVATIDSGADETLIGGASYTVLRSSGSARAAEVSFTIEEDYHGQGLAGKLLELLVGIAREHGIIRFEADVLSGNAPMVSVFAHSGLTMVTTKDDGVTHVVLDLRPSAEHP
jgi:RimJ/RimL family protein N-acetyltransferase